MKEAATPKDDGRAAHGSIVAPDPAPVYVPNGWTQLRACRAANTAAFVQSWRRPARSAVVRLAALDAAGLWLHEGHPVFGNIGTATP